MGTFSEYSQVCPRRAEGGRGRRKHLPPLLPICLAARPPAPGRLAWAPPEGALGLEFRGPGGGFFIGCRLSTTVFLCLCVCVSVFAQT